jgi:hypothetical protein
MVDAMTGFNSKRDAAADKDALFEKFEVAQPAQDVDYWIREATAARQAEMAMRRELDAQPAQDGKCKLCVDGCAACDARAQPAQRTWIWLSDADIKETIDSICQYSGDYDEFLCKKIEKKIKELNT